MKCSICGNEIKGYSHNADPINDGRCCTECNNNIVIQKRIEMMNSTEINVLNKAAIAQANFEKQMMEMAGYETMTTFYGDFTIADAFGAEAIIDTYKRAFAEWKDNIEYLTELTMVLNHKIWEHHRRENTALMVTYDTLWKKADEWCVSNLEDKDLEYYLRITD